MTHMEVAGGYLKQIWLESGWAKRWQVFLESKAFGA